MKNNSIWIAPLLVAGAGLSCGSIKVTAKGNGIRTGNNAVETVSLAVTRGNADAINTSRLYVFEGRPLTENHRLPACQLAVSITGNPNNLGESYVYLQTLPEDLRFDGGTSADKSFIANNVGKLANMKVGQTNGSSSATTNTKSHFGLGVLAILQNDDRTIPWRLTTSSGRCFPIGSGCFDMETLSKLFFNNIKGSIESTIATIPGTPEIDVQELLYVPHVIHRGFENEGTRARGFGFIYHVKIKYITGNVEVYFPLNLVFTNNINSYRLFIDPLDNSQFTPTPTVLSNMYVKAEGVTTVFEFLIRDKIVEAITAIEPTEIIPGIDNGEALMAAFNGAAGSNPPLSGAPPQIYNKYDVLLLPDSDTRLLENTVLWRRTGTGETENINKVKLVFLE